MSQRVRYTSVEPESYKTLLGVSEYVRSTEIEKPLRELIFTRASQINRCAFCLDMHTRDAIEGGESAQRLFALSAWRDTPFFTPKERAALALTEHVTLISNGGVPDDVYEALTEFFSPKQIVQLIMTIISINSWNRIAISTGMQPPAP